MKAAREATEIALKTLALSLVAMFALGLPILIPASFFFSVDRLELYPTGHVIPDTGVKAESNVVLQSRDPLDWFGGLNLGWSAVVYEIDYRPADRQDFARNVCHGSGRFYYRPQEPDGPFSKPKLLSLRTWSGDDGCALRPGHTYVLYGQWTYRWGLWSWTADKLSPPVTVPEASE